MPPRQKKLRLHKRVVVALIDTLVIGDGITGAFIAYLLAQQGNAPVVIAGDETSPASHFNPGGINPLHGPGIPGDMEEFSMQAYCLHMAHWERIRVLSGIDFSGRIIERLFLAFADTEKNKLLDQQELYHRHEGFSAQWLTPSEIAVKEPRLADNSLGGLYTRGNATVDARRYTEAVMTAAQAGGAAIIDKAVTALVKRPDGYAVICRGGKSYAAKRVVVAAGSWTQHILASLGLDFPLKPIKGELLMIEVARPFGFDVTCGNDGLYHFRDHLYWLGGTREDVGFDVSVSAQGMRGLMAKASVLIPGAGSFTVKDHVAAMRPTTPDGMPIVGCLTSQPDLYIATGAGSKGMLWSARMAAAIVTSLGGHADNSSEFLTPERFTARK